VTPELIADTKRYLEDLLSFFEVNAEVEAKASEDTITLAVAAEGGGRLIGHRGESLAALQHLVNMMVRQRTRERIYVHVDIGGYRQARLAKLEEQAREVAQRVREEGAEASLPLMSAAERRHIHAALTDEPGVTTESQGEGNRRRLVIKPA
jgi:spoIIIJ-associated protein